MALTFFEQRKRQRKFILISALIIFLTVILIWKFFLLPKPEPEPKVVEIPRPPEIKIDFEVLKSPILEKLQPFEEISPFEGEVGRENPFIPY